MSEIMSELIPTSSALPPSLFASASAPEPVISPLPPVHLRIIYFLSIWTFKTLINTGLYLRGCIIHPPASQLRPNIRTYPIRPTLKNRIFIPPSSSNDRGERNGFEKFSLYISVHGGGWAAASPEADDEFCSHLCLKNNIMVASLDYRKSPTYRFPFAVTDIASLVSAILSDTSLPIDVSKVAIGGFSAGGNLTFAACQTEELKGKISAVVGFYPVLDMTESRETKEGRRPKGPDVPRDEVGWSADFLDWGYVPQGQDRRDPLLSPRYAERSEMPKNVYLAGAEWDMLCFEAGTTAEGLAVGGDERKEVKGEGWDGWVQGGIRWECFRKRSHAFTHVKQWNRKWEEERVRIVEELYDRVGSWLAEDVWAE
ncbi:related to triacylglycerol lipase [Phialocephala subalpina]|uniref:Related to triacylglycerol lipase n=1 Tax=Phialocephala subalpina TaxID=576137 RepID=A0A1L7X4X9_9HELO|nr:related to triacylglycerol lipase [Phialocephala subalpina]